MVAPSRLLPIDLRRADIDATLARSRNLVLLAEPGAGKTTRVPWFLLEADPGGGSIIVSQPRRVAARMAAARVAATSGEAVGERIGYQVRFERRIGERTRIQFVTEGILAQRLRSDPELTGVATVVLDEFHERHLEADVALALLRRLQRGPRPDLRIVVMSATIEPEPLAVYLDAAMVRCEGRTFAVELEHLTRASDRPVGSQVAEALRSLLERGVSGSVLVFLPGAYEIAEVGRACAPVARRGGWEVCPLHGSLPAAEQDRAVLPGPPRVVLSTNLAETSVTIDGVVAVIDSGLARQASQDPWTGISRLGLGKISQASAVQRAGRAGRTQAGTCLRLYTEHDLQRRPPFDRPEIERQDLARALLDLRASGVVRPETFEWFEPPPTPAVEAAELLLRRLGAVAPDGALTSIGRRMLSLPVHPRLARVVVAGRDGPENTLVSGVAAVLSEGAGRPPLRRGVGADVVTRCDPLADLEALRGGGGSRRHPAVQTIERVWRQLCGDRAWPEHLESLEPRVLEALLTGFSDRVAKRRSDGEGFVLTDGKVAALSPDSTVRDADYLLVLEAATREGGTRGPRLTIHSAAEVEPDAILEHCLDEVVESLEVSFDAARERVVAREELRLGSISIETRILRELPPEATQTLREAALKRGPSAFAPPGALQTLQVRSEIVSRFDPSVGAVGEEDARRVLSALCEGRGSFEALRRADLVAHLVMELDEAGRALDRLAPRHVVLPAGRRVEVHYEHGREPWIQSRLQDFFGASAGPAIVGGRLPLVLHLLAPNRRAVQVTTDLAGFWDVHYPGLRKSLMRRYPKHAWPEDPTVRPPPRSGTRAKR